MSDVQRSPVESRSRAAAATLRRAANPLTWLARLRLALTRHEELTGIVFWAALVGVCGALASVAFRESIRFLHWILTGHQSGLAPGGLVMTAESLPAWERVVIPVVGGLLAGATLQVGYRVLRTRRPPDYMEAVVVGNGVLGIRATLIQSLSSLFTIASGGSIGREGPMVHLAATLASKIGQLTGAPVPRLRLLVACGAAAGIASAYNAPIAGALFVAEIVMGSLAMEAFAPLVVASVTANATIHYFLGYGPLFQPPRFQLASTWELACYALLGVLLGHIAPTFLGLLEGSKRLFGRMHLPLSLKLGLGGLVVGGISVFFPQVWGNGYSVLGSILAGNLAGQALAMLLAAKLASTAATVGSGGVGGVFTPTLFVGGSIGALVGAGLHALLPGFVSTPSAYALVGMGGFLAATTHAPLTSILIVFEMTLDYQIVLPLMLACVTGHYVAKIYRGGESIYDQVLKRIPEASGEDDWRLRNVGALIGPATSVRRGSTLRELFAELRTGSSLPVFVVDRDRQLLGTIDPQRAYERLQQHELDADTQVEDVMAPALTSLTPRMPLCDALDHFLRERVIVLPVTTGRWNTTLLGQVSRQDLMLAVQDRLSLTR